MILLRSRISQANPLETKELEGTTLSRRKDYFLRDSERVRSTMAYLSRPGPVLVEYKTFNRLKDKFDLVPDRDNKSAYDPTKLVAQLGRYGTRPKLSYDHSVMEQAKAVTLRTFGGKGKLRPHALDENLRVFSKQVKSSGLPELERKGEAFDRDLFRAGKILRNERAPYPCVAYHRVQHGLNGPKTRLVWGYPQSMFLIEARFAPQLIDHFLDTKTPMAFGLRKSQVSARLQRITNSGLRYSLDFSGFDSSIHAEFIDFAFQVLSTHFIFSDEERDAWNKVINYFIHTPIMLPNRQVWVKHHGVPSGSYFTQMIDSIVNYLAVNYAWIKLSGLAVPEDRVLVLGDDSIIGQSRYVALSTLVHSMSEMGLKLNADKTGVSRFGDGDPHFLGHFWWKGMPNRPLREIAVRLCFPETPSGIKDPAERDMIRTLSYASDSLSAQDLILELAPHQSHCVDEMYSSFLSKGDPSREIEAKMRPGMQAHMEDMGFLPSLNPYSLAETQPTIGIWH